MLVHDLYYEENAERLPGHHMPKEMLAERRRLIRAVPGPPAAEKSCANDPWQPKAHSQAGLADIEYRHGRGGIWVGNGVHFSQADARNNPFCAECGVC